MENWRRCYPYATVIHRESDQETLDSISDRLEEAMECQDPVIIIRCLHVGALIKGWMNFGNIVRQASSASSLASLILSVFRQDLIPQVLAISGLVLYVIHCYVWKFDRSYQYTVLSGSKFLEDGDFGEVVLVRKPRTGTFLLRTVIVASALAIAGYFYLNGKT
ncbi:uncharacterized protein LOC118182765 isoform X2 [Stegodyphus dumicola]|uniref:uncharacterized protein LOC118182765 isoform X2 n=1 Tax=Stegodyphus dumicola TaxID=202533 RepID=UPI0015A81F8B|nr:uncharacterized protein LOC118182765 isoform X2 [Stegodyphus dumicola]